MKYLKLKEKIKKLENKNFNLEWYNFRLKQKNEELKTKIEELEAKQKEPISFNISMDKESVDDIVKKVTENVLGKQKHECTEICFKHHVLDPIQADIYSRFGDDVATRSKNLDEIVQFVETWRKKLIIEYPFLKDLYTMNFGKLTAVYE